MKLHSVVLLGLAAGSLQLRRPHPKSFPNHTLAASALDTTKDVVKLVSGSLPPPVPKQLVRRPPTDPYLSLYENAEDDVLYDVTCKGAALLKAMRGTDQEAGSVFKPPRASAAGRFENTDSLSEEGWDMVEDAHVPQFERWGMARILGDIGVSDSCTDAGGSVYCMTFAHGYEDPEDDRPVPLDEQTYVHNGRMRRSTGGRYTFGFDPANGVIIAMDRESPAVAGKTRYPPVEGADLPALRSSSDIAWLAWKLLGPPDLSNIRYFLSLSISNELTQLIIASVIREAVPGTSRYPGWGGYEFETDTEEGHALLGTPNAVAFSYFLLQHKAALGNLYISKIRVFQDDRRDPAPNLLFVVEHVSKDVEMTDAEDVEMTDAEIVDLKDSAIDQNKEKVETKRLGARTGTKRLVNSTAPESNFDSDKIHTGAVSPGDLPLPLPLTVRPQPPPGQQEKVLRLYQSASDEEWNKAQCKGSGFRRAMRGSDAEAGRIYEPARDSAASAFEDPEDIFQWGWEMIGTTAGKMSEWGIEHILQSMGVSDRAENVGGDIVVVALMHGQSYMSEDGWIPVDRRTYEVNGRQYRHTAAHYAFGIDEKNGVILALDRNSPQHEGQERNPPVVGTDELPKLRAFSDIAWLTWKEEASDPKNIQYFMSLSIVNEQTQRILSRAIREVLPGAWCFPEWGRFEFDTQTLQGQAILGTPNAQAFSYFLLQHKATLGNLYISKVRVFRDDRDEPYPNILMIVEPVQGGEEPEETPTPDDQGLVNTEATSHRLRRYTERAKL